MTLIKSISGIRGTLGGLAGQGLTPTDITKFTAAYGTWLLRNGGKPLVVVGRDARPSGEMVNRLVTGTLMGLGIDVIDLGLSTTPTVELAVTGEQAGGGIILTASHNPQQWNALKLLNDQGEFVSAEAGQEILDIAEDPHAISFAEHKKIGSYRTDDTWLKKHIDLVLNHPLVDKAAIAAKNFKIAVEAVNSSGGIFVPALLEALGVKTIGKYACEPNGQFPHNPEPLAENLSSFMSEMAKGNFDLGIVVDPDVDRLVFIAENGDMFGEEYTLVAVADYVLSQNPGNTVSNLSSTQALKVVTLKHGGEYHAAAVGEVNVVTKMKAVNAVIGGEGNGGVIVPDLHYGRDALIGIGLFLTHLAKSDKSVTMLRAQYPNFYMSKNKIELTPEVNVDAILVAIAKRYAKQPINQEDGVKIEFDEQWVHLRKSNTEPIIRIYAEAPSLNSAETLANKIISDIREVVNATS